MARTGRPKIDLTGKKMPGTMLTVVRQAEKRKQHIRWECLCDCGNTTVVFGHCLRSAQIKSCGCLLSKLKGKTPTEASFNSLYCDYRRRAQDYNRAFELSKDEFAKLTSSDCFYCGLSPSSGRRTTSLGKTREVYIFNGIDRVDNNYGYVLGNCVPCCERCNKAKLAHSQIDFIRWIKQAHDHMEKNHFFVTPDEIYLVPLEKAA